MPIEFNSVEYTYSPGTPFEKRALEELSITIRDGEFVAVLGKTGSGKSTFVQLMNGILKPTIGKVMVDGIDTLEKGEEAFMIKKKVGLVFQYPEHQFFEENVISELSFGPKNFGLDEETTRRNILKAIEMVGLERNVLLQSPFSLSGGEKRKVALASVLACDPKYIVFDEPTSGLDPISVKRLSKTLGTLKKTGKTLIVVTHSVEFALENFDRILFFSNGKLISDSPKEEFVSLSGVEEMLPDAYLLARAIKDLHFTDPTLIRDLSVLRKFLR